MNLILKLLSTPWFWVDVALSISGGFLVFWGHRMEKIAEELIPPENFKPDIFKDIVDRQKAAWHRGWRILMAGIIVEVVAALGISIISGLEIADLSDKTAAANLKAEQAGRDAAETKLATEELVSTNLVLRGELAGLEKDVAELGFATLPRMIRNREMSMKTLTNWAGVKVKIFSTSTNEEPQALGSDISALLSTAKWVTLRQSAVSNAPVRAVRIGLNTNGMRLDEIEKSEEAADALRKELNKNGITAFIGVGIVSGARFPMDNVPQGCVFVAIGDRLPILVDRYFRHITETNRPNFRDP